MKTIVNVKIQTYWIHTWVGVSYIQNQGTEHWLGILDMWEGTQQGNVYMNGRHRNAEMGGNMKWDLYYNGKQGQDLIASDFECRMEVPWISELMWKWQWWMPWLRTSWSFVSKCHISVMGHNRWSNWVGQPGSWTVPISLCEPTSRWLVQVAVHHWVCLQWQDPHFDILVPLHAWHWTEPLTWHGAFQGISIQDTELICLEDGSSH